MVVYPLSAAEERLIRWAGRIIPGATIALIVLMGAMSVASAHG